MQHSWLGDLHVRTSWQPFHIGYVSHTHTHSLREITEETLTGTMSSHIGELTALTQLFESQAR